MGQKKAHLSAVDRAEHQVLDRRRSSTSPVHSREYCLDVAFDANFRTHDRLPRRPDRPHRSDFGRVAAQAGPVVAKADLRDALRAPPGHVPSHRAHDGLQHGLQQDLGLARRQYAPHERPHVIRERPTQPIRRVVLAPHRIRRACHPAPVDLLCQQRHLRRQAQEQLRLGLNRPVHPRKELRQVDVENVQPPPRPPRILHGCLQRQPWVRSSMARRPARLRCVYVPLQPTERCPAHHLQHQLQLLRHQRDLSTLADALRIVRRLLHQQRVQHRFPGGRKHATPEVMQHRCVQGTQPLLARRLQQFHGQATGAHRLPARHVRQHPQKQVKRELFL